MGKHRSADSATTTGSTEPLILDGGLATALQSMGLPAYTPCEPWVDRHPERVRAAHQAFVDAGSQIVLTATFGCRDRALAERAVGLARSTGVQVWLSLGPNACRKLASLPVDGVVLETFTELQALEEAVREVRPLTRTTLVGSLVPLQQLPADAPERLARAGADGIGLNCASSERCLEQLERWSDALPIWLKPSDVVWNERARWIGGCCGVSPAQIASLTPREVAQLSKAGPKTAN